VTGDERLLAVTTGRPLAIALRISSWRSPRRDHFDDDVVARFVHHLPGVRDEHAFREAHAAVARQVEIRHAFQVQDRTETGGNQVTLVQQQPGHPRSHRSAAEKADVDLPHS